MAFPAVPPIVREPLYPLLLLSCATALGDLFLGRLRASSGGATRLELGAVSAAIGLGLLSLGVFVLAMAGQLRPVPLIVFAILIFTATLPRQIGIARSALSALRSPTTRDQMRACLPWLVPMVPVLALTVLGALAPPTDPDGLYYQLTAPRRWLAAGRLEYLPTLPQTNLPAGVNLLFALGMATWGDIAAKATHLIMGWLALATLFALGRRWIDTRSGGLLAALWLLGTASVFALRVPDLFTYAYVDLGVALESIAAVLAWLLWRRSGSTRWLAGAALCAGFAASFKFTAVLTGAGLAALTGWVLLREGSGLRKASTSGALFLAIALAPVVPWLARTWASTGNPFYLMGAGLFPTRDWPADAAAVFAEYFKTWVWGMGMTASWGESTRKAVRLASMAVVAIATGVHAVRSRDEESRGFGVLAGVLVLGSLAGTGLYLRYVLFALPLFWLVVLRRAAPWLREHGFLRVAVVALLAINGVLATRPLAAHLPDRISFAMGRLSRSEYLARCLPSTALWNFVNATLPKDRPILLAAGRDNYYIEAPCLVSEAYYQHAVRMDTWEHFQADLTRWGVRHVIANPTKTRKSYPGPAWPHADNEAPFLQRLINEEATPLARFGDDAVYAIKPEFLGERSAP
ncbi:MAG: hypothetical protein ACKO5K_15360 [Armatimonadota bacterium]